MGNVSTVMETITNLKWWPINGKKFFYNYTLHKGSRSRKYKVLKNLNAKYSVNNRLMNWIHISKKKKYKNKQQTFEDIYYISSHKRNEH